MAASPLRTPFCEQTNGLDVSQSCSNDPQSDKSTLKWKEPALTDKVKPIPESKSDLKDNTALPPLENFNWKTPTFPTKSDQTTVDDTVLSQTRIKKEPPPSSSATQYDENDDAAFDMESVLLEEELYSVPEYNRHRTETGLTSLDEILAFGTHEYVNHDCKEVGLASGSILEVAGTPGSGKTSLLIQIAVLDRLKGILRKRESFAGKEKGREASWMELGDASQQVMLIGE